MVKQPVRPTNLLETCKYMKFARENITVQKVTWHVPDTVNVKMVQTIRSHSGTAPVQTKYMGDKCSYVQYDVIPLHTYPCSRYSQKWLILLLLQTCLLKKPKKTIMTKMDARKDSNK